MASFGWSIGDIVTLISLTRQAYNGWRSAGKRFEDITQTLESFEIVLQHVDHRFVEMGAAEGLRDRRKELDRILRGCKSAVVELGDIARRYRRLGNWDRLRLGLKDISSPNERLVRHMVMLSNYLLMMEMESIGKDLRALPRNYDQVPHRIQSKVPIAFGKMLDSRAKADDIGSTRSSILTTYGDDDKKAYRELRRNLRALGIRDSDVRENRHELLELMRSVLRPADPSKAEAVKVQTHEIPTGAEPEEVDTGFVLTSSSSPAITDIDAQRNDATVNTVGTTSSRKIMQAYVESDDDDDGSIDGGDGRLDSSMPSDADSIDESPSEREGQQTDPDIDRPNAEPESDTDAGSQMDTSDLLRLPPDVDSSEKSHERGAYTTSLHLDSDVPDPHQESRMHSDTQFLGAEAIQQSRSQIPLMSETDSERESKNDTGSESGWESESPTFDRGISDTGAISGAIPLTVDAELVSSASSDSVSSESEHEAGAQEMPSVQPHSSKNTWTRSDRDNWYALADPKCEPYDPDRKRYSFNPVWWLGLVPESLRLAYEPLDPNVEHRLTIQLSLDETWPVYLSIVVDRLDLDKAARPSHRGHHDCWMYGHGFPSASNAHGWSPDTYSGCNCRVLEWTPELETSNRGFLNGLRSLVKHECHWEGEVNPPQASKRPGET